MQSAVSLHREGEHLRLGRCLKWHDNTVSGLTYSGVQRLSHCVE